MKMILFHGILEENGGVELVQRNDLQKLIKLTGDRAKLDAKANQTYVVYIDSNGNMVKEYFNGIKEFLKNEDQEHDCT